MSNAIGAPDIWWLELLAHFNVHSGYPFSIYDCTNLRRVRVQLPALHPGPAG